ncbi:HAD family hydrolase [Streptomyces lasalocidi]|uniref:Haloacid dehalogenase n=1 Tax=Streptomyces lasalocidi TaxID=324833 RepID=A0A4U5WR06_STRLS|nr:haloacid dehalogenase [Streptomyces lasalocidi]TKT04747.1 haloacid dehalogenase [Streptomyces lasalocidi]
MSISPHVGAVFFSAGVLIEETNPSRLMERRLGLRTAPEGDEEPRLDASRWAGVPTRLLCSELGSLRPLPGVRETAAWCWDHRLLPVIATAEWAPIGAYLAELLGFHSHTGTTLEARGGLFTGRGTAPVGAAGSCAMAVRRAADLGLRPEDCAVVSADGTDAPLFDAVGCGVAFNAPPEVRCRSTTAVDDEDLRAVIPALEHMAP